MIVQLGAKLVVGFGKLDADGDVVLDGSVIPGLTREYRVAKLNADCLIEAANKAIFDRGQLSLAYVPSAESEVAVGEILDLDAPPALTLIDGGSTDENEGTAGAPVPIDDPLPPRASGDAKVVSADTEPVLIEH